jgi:hypothetical protein
MLDLLKIDIKKSVRNSWIAGCCIVCLTIGIIIGHIIKIPKKMAMGQRSIVSSPDDPIIKAFINAHSLVPTWNARIYPPVVSWDQKVDLGCGLTFVVLADEFVEGRFEAKLPNESTTRTMVIPGDYVYPCAIRINHDSKRMYFKASGLVGGLYPETRIYEYDPLKWQLVSMIVVDQKILPQDPQPLEPRPR